MLPDGDRRCRQSWIDAIAGVNPPLLQLLETSPAEVQAQEAPLIETVEASPAAEDVQAQEAPLESKFGRIVYPRPSQGAVSQVAKIPPAVEVDRVHEAISEVAKTSPGVDRPPLRKLARLPENRLGDKGLIRTLPLAQLKKIAAERNIFLDSERREDWIEAIIGWIEAGDRGPRMVDSEGFELGFLPPSVDDYLKSFKDSENSPGVELDLEECRPECVECFDDGLIDQASGFIKFCHCSSGTKLSRQNAQSAIIPVAKNLPGRSKTSTAHQLLELFKSSAHIIEDSPASEAEPKVSQSAISPAVVTNQIESDLNPNLTGLSFSDRFLARYSPPQAEVFQFQADADGQLTLIDFKVQSAPEPPDPDDFDSLDAFREAIAHWDAQNPEPLDVSLDSMCEWAPCPEEWYEPEPESLPLKASSMMELSPPAIECSITSANFTIPTFDAWCDRANRQTDTDEPPDTGIFARLPGPKPPNFPPQVSPSQTKSAQVDQASRNYPEAIPKLFHRVAAGSSNQPARSPPGGDANFA